MNPLLANEQSNYNLVGIISIEVASNKESGAKVSKLKEKHDVAGLDRNVIAIYGMILGFSTLRSIRKKLMFSFGASLTSFEEKRPRRPKGNENIEGCRIIKVTKGKKKKR